MDYIVKWDNTEKVVGKVEYFTNSLAIPNFPSKQKIQSDSNWTNWMDMLLIGLVRLPRLHRYWVLFECYTTSSTDAIYFVYDSNVRGKFNSVVLTQVNPGIDNNQVLKAFIQKVSLEMIGG